MEKVWVLIWIIMTPQGSGVFEKTQGMTGPLDEHTCYTLLMEMNDLAAKQSVPHAHIGLCRKITPEDAEILNRLQKKERKDDDPGRRT